MDVPTLDEIRNVLVRVHAPNRSSSAMLSECDYAKAVRELLLLSGAVPFTLGIARAHVGQRIVMFSDYFFTSENYDGGPLAPLDDDVGHGRLTWVDVSSIQDGSWCQPSTVSYSIVWPYVNEPGDHDPDYDPMIKFSAFGDSEFIFYDSYFRHVMWVWVQKGNSEE
jgi:hypothetical protein